MKLGREHALAAFIALALLIGGVWLALNTEWVEVKVPDPLKGPALLDPNYRLKQLATRLGAEVSAPGNLDRMPPQDATLVLSSIDWNLLPGRAERLRAWVEGGGHLWMPYQGNLGDGLGWIPVEHRRFKRPPAPAAPALKGAEHDDDEDDEESDNTPAPAPRAGPKPRCPGVDEAPGSTPAFGAPRSFDACLYGIDELVPKATPQWGLREPRGLVVARVPVGLGSVTVTSAYMPWSNQQLLRGDNAELAAATLRIHRGQALWFVQSEARPPLVSFLWSSGAPAVLLFGIALGLALWRAAVRFGPWLAPLPMARRSVSEQIRGTSEFILHHGGTALHAAQLNALGDAARTRLQGYEALGLEERAHAIAKAARLDAAALARAMSTEAGAAWRRHPASALALLEMARRRLLDAATHRSAIR